MPLLMAEPPTVMAHACNKQSQHRGGRKMFEVVGKAHTVCVLCFHVLIMLSWKRNATCDKDATKFWHVKSFSFWKDIESKHNFIASFFHSATCHLVHARLPSLFDTWQGVFEKLAKTQRQTNFIATVEQFNAPNLHWLGFNYEIAPTLVWQQQWCWTKKLQWPKMQFPTMNKFCDNGTNFCLLFDVTISWQSW